MGNTFDESRDFFSAAQGFGWPLDFGYKNATAGREVRSEGIRRGFLNISRAVVDDDPGSRLESIRSTPVHDSWTRFCPVVHKKRKFEIFKLFFHFHGPVDHGTKTGPRVVDRHGPDGLETGSSEDPPIQMVLRPVDQSTAREWGSVPEADPPSTKSVATCVISRFGSILAHVKNGPLYGFVLGIRQKYFPPVCFCSADPRPPAPRFIFGLQDPEKTF